MTDSLLKQIVHTSHLNLLEEKGMTQAWLDWLLKRLQRLKAKALRRLPIQLQIMPEGY